MFVPRKVREVGEVFIDEGFRAFVVGGAVRDYFLGSYVKDFDLVVDVSSFERLLDLLELGGDWQVFPLSRAWGVVRVLSGSFIVDVSLMRVGFKGGSPVFGRNLFRDLMLRDFTVDAVAFDLVRREFVDPVGGLGDLRRRVIRTPLDPGVSLGVDPARVLRAVGLSLRLGFRLDQELVWFLGGPVERILDYRWAPRLNFEFQKWVREVGCRFVKALESLGLWDLVKRLVVSGCGGLW